MALRWFWRRAQVDTSALLFCSSALVLCLTMVPAYAEDKPALEFAQPDKRSFGTVKQTFDIPAGDLAAALKQWASATRFKLLAPTNALKGLTTGGVSGNMTAEAALRQLLGSTRLKYGMTGNRSVTVYDQDSALTAHAQSVQLDTIEVSGQGGGQGDVQGFVAKRSSAGTKTDTPIIEIPQSISVVTRDQMDARAVQTVVEALQYTPGVYAHGGGKDPRFDSFSIRGFSAYESGVYRDGLREPNGSFALFRTEPYGLQRVDVVRGPSSVLYGQSNPGGLIDLITKRPTATPIREVVGQYATADRFEGAFDLGGAADKDAKYLFRLTGVARDSDAQIAHFSNFVKDDRLFIAPAFTWQPTQDTKLTILTDFQRDLTGNVFTVPVATLGPGFVVTNVHPSKLFLGDPNWNKFEQDQFRLGYQFEHRFSDALTFKQNLRYGEIDLDYRYLTFNLIPATPTSTSLSRVARVIDERTNNFTVDNQLHSKFDTGPLQHTVLAGLDYQSSGLDTKTFGDPMLPAPPVPALTLNLRNPVYGISVATPTTVLSSVDQDAKQLGVYLQDQVKLQNWLLTIGGRYDWADQDSLNRVTAVDTKTSDEAFTKRVGLTYLFDFGLAPYASYSESFLPTPGFNVSSNPFKPTKAQQYEAGIKYQMPNTNLLVTLAAFDITQQNVLKPDPVNLGYNIQIGEVRSRGFEAQVTASLTQGLNLVASYTYLDLEVTETSTPAELGKVPILSPREMASAWADYTFQTGPLTGFGFGGGVRYIGSTFMDPANLLVNDAYTVFDAALHYKVKDGMNLALNVSNIANKTVAACTTAGGCQWTSPRIVTGTLTYRW